ncbi:MAG: deoxyuridine 5'-triphosphate nucleotidohydrolase [Patescibacteria group bacterium]
MEISFRKLTPDTPTPEYKTPGAVAFDIAVTEEGALAPGERKMFRTGLVIRIPDGHTLILAPRSSNAKKGIQIAHGIGIIDQDYCGPDDELRLFLYNIGTESYPIEKYERIAQGMFVPVTKGVFIEPPHWDVKNNRGGFGTTG